MMKKNLMLLVVAAALSVSNATGQSLRIWRDGSSSVSESDLQKILPTILTAIRNHTDLVEGVEVVTFSQAGEATFTATPERFWWGRRPAVDAFLEPDRTKAPLSVRLYEAAWRDYVGKARSKYETETARALGEYEQRRDTELQRLNTYLSTQPKRPARCTRFTALADRVQGEDLPWNAILTDGWIDCPQILRAHRQVRGRTLVVLLPRNGDTGPEEEIFNKREAQMHKLLPSAKVVPAYLVGRGLEELLTGSN